MNEILEPMIDWEIGHLMTAAYDLWNKHTSAKTAANEMDILQW